MKESKHLNKMIRAYNNIHRFIDKYGEDSRIVNKWKRIYLKLYTMRSYYSVNKAKKPKYKSYFVRDYTPEAKYKYKLENNEITCYSNSSRKQSKKLAAERLRYYYIEPVYYW